MASRKTKEPQAASNSNSLEEIKHFLTPNSVSLG